METTKTQPTKKPLADRQALLDALQLSLVDALQRGDITKALQCSKLYKLIKKGN